MTSIKGRYEYDDDGLTPGKKKEGGLHQNLFDSEGNLKGSARFIPDDEDESGPLPVADPVYIYVTDESRQRSREHDELVEAVSLLLSRLIDIAVAKATPHAKRFWYERARPAIKSKWDRRPRSRRTGRQLPSSEPIVVEATVVDSSQELMSASEEYRTNMSSAEAQARYLMALAAKAFSEEQMRIVASANIEDVEGFMELKRALAELPPRQVAKMIERLEANPTLLNDDKLDLGTIFGIGRADGDYLPARPACGTTTPTRPTQPARRSPMPASTGTAPAAPRPAPRTRRTPTLPADARTSAATPPPNPVAPSLEPPRRGPRSPAPIDPPRSEDDEYPPTPAL